MPTILARLMCTVVLGTLLSGCSSGEPSKTRDEVDRYCRQLGPAFAMLTQHAKEREYEALFAVWKRSGIGIDVHEHVEFCSAIRGAAGVEILSTYLAEVASPVRILLMKALAGTGELSEQSHADLVATIQSGSRLVEQLLQLPLE